MGIARSEFLEEPGTNIQLASGIILENTIFSKLFHSMQALKTKLFLLKSSLTFGILKDKFESLKLGTNLKLYIDTGHLNFIILSVSMLQCYLYKFSREKILCSLKSGFVCSRQKFFFSLC